MRIAPVLSLVLALCICQAASETESCEYDNAAISALPVVTDVTSTPVKQDDHSMIYTVIEDLIAKILADKSADCKTQNSDTEIEQSETELSSATTLQRPISEQTMIRCENYFREIIDLEPSASNWEFYINGGYIYCPPHYLYKKPS